jgi:hypothetical protein
MVSGSDRIIDQVALQSAELIQDVVSLAVDGGDVGWLGRRGSGFAAATTATAACATSP